MTIRDLMHWNRPSLIPIDYRNSFSQSLASLQEDMNRLFDHVYNGALAHTTNWGANTPAAPAVNIVERDDSFKVDIELAGIDPKNVEVEAADGFLTFSGEREEKKEDKKQDKEGSYLRQEISYGSFVRTIGLPETANCEKAEASFRNGILTVMIPKKAAAIQKPKKIPVKQAA